MELNCTTYVDGTCGMDQGSLCVCSAHNFKQTFRACHWKNHTSAGTRAVPMAGCIPPRVFALPSRADKKLERVTGWAEGLNVKWVAGVRRHHAAVTPLTAASRMLVSCHSDQSLTPG